ncbi:MAG: sodium:solute symporter [Saprospiraceae bacterium]|nr:sodium:solute symporter [Candidatus Vicinibacter proximus]MCC6842114.1 sodium:solute symporter [Saprospiraceae bacterium]
MSWIDWLVLTITISFIVIYGWYKSRSQQDLNSYLLGEQNSVWWKVCLGVMATQASAITFISTTGQGFSDGLRFVQFYFGLPLAMFVIIVIFIPAFYRLKVFTAYEYLEQRFDLKTRLFAAFIFLIQRGLAAGITLYAPAIILSTVLGWNLQLTQLVTGVLVIIYTVSGGSKAVTVTQTHQMAIIILGMAFIFGFLIYSMPAGFTLDKTLELAGWNGKMKGVDFNFNFQERYNFWAGITGGFFLALAYFGTDQSQVQRYLSGRNVRQSQVGLLFNGLLKIPMQIFILMCGVLLFVFFQFEKTPISYNAKVEQALKLNHPEKYNLWTKDLNEIHNQRIDILQSEINLNKDLIVSLNMAQKKIRDTVQTFIRNSGERVEANDKDYIFLYYILKYLPKGFIGLLLAVIFCAAMSSISAELNALAGTTSVDIQKRLFQSTSGWLSDLQWSRLFTVFWGILAISFAFYANLFENLIQFINIIGSLFYGSVLGIFIVAFLFPKVNGNIVFFAACLAQSVVFVLFFTLDIGFLWYNVIASGIVTLVSIILSFFKSTKMSI